LTLYAGIDIGSLSTDVVLLDKNLTVVGSAITATGASTRKAARETLDAALLAGGAKAQEIAFTVATGYGRESAEGADLRVTEITCHARGARRLFPEASTVLDIGSHQEVCAAITVHVPAPVHVEGELVRRPGMAVGSPVGRRQRSRGGAEERIRASVIRISVCVLRCPDSDIVVEVVVQVASPADRKTEVRARLISQDGPYLRHLKTSI